MFFDADSGTLKCDACGHSEKIEGVQKEEEYRAMDDSAHEDSTFQDEDVVQYQCQNCGAVVMTDKNTTATTCSFCGAPVVLGDRMTGALAPDRVIPFQITKDAAQQAFRRWRAGLTYSPKEFRTNAKLKEITGMYVPFWLYDTVGQGEGLFHCTRSHEYSEGDYDVTETMHYDVYRKADTTYRRIPADASERMADDLMDLLEPFDYSQLKPFDTPYLAGYLAEKYDYSSSDLFPRVEKRTSEYLDAYLRNSINGYHTVEMIKKDYHIHQQKADYALLPVWMAYYDYEHGEYAFAMNGETGKVAGRPPVSVPTAAAHIAGWTGVIFAVCRLITVLLGGPIL